MKYCSKTCARAVEYASANDRQRRSDHYRRRRAAKKGSQVEKVRYLDVAERDGWKCHLCTRRVDPRIEWPDDLSGSLDHLIPLSKGGAHTPENVALAHLGCNICKGDGGTDQLLLIG